MTDPDAPIRTTHVGSLVRPAELVAYLRKIDAGDDYDEQAYQECLARSVRDVVQAQRDAGIDIVSDGEFGKSAWNYYVYERLGGIELRPSPPGDANFASVNDAPTDWARFPEFYADYFAHEQEYESPGGDWACVAPVTYTGGEVIARDIANLKAAMDAAGAQEGFLPVVAPASCFPSLIDEHYGSEEAALLGIADALAEEYRAIVDAGLNLQIDDAYIPFMYDVLVPPGHDGRLPGVGPAAHRRAQPRARGDPAGQGPLPRLLGQLERPAHQRHRAARRPGAHVRRSTPAPTSTSTPTRATSTSGASGRTSTCRPARRSPRASSATRRTSSSTPSSWPSASSAPRGSSAPSTSWPARTAASPRARTSSACTRRSSGRSSARSRRGPSSPRAR